jgi:hypothetical protein
MTEVLVGQQSPDLESDGMLNNMDWSVFSTNFRIAGPDLDGDRQTTILDWFYRCNRERQNRHSNFGSYFTLIGIVITDPFVDAVEGRQPGAYLGSESRVLQFFLYIEDKTFRDPLNRVTEEIQVLYIHVKLGQL